MHGSVKELGESATLRLLLAELRAGSYALVGPGDDCAQLLRGACDVVTSDTMFEGPDFRLDWHTPWQLGWKIAAVNLSDVAAMGAIPTGITVAVGAPHETPVQVLVELARGIQAACDELAPGCGVVGGDLASAPVLSLAVTAFGTLRTPPAGAADVGTQLAGHPAGAVPTAPEVGQSALPAASGISQSPSPVLRSGARPGDLLCYAGQGLGLSGLGLHLLLQASGEAPLTAADRAALLASHALPLAAHLTPRPPVALGEEARFAGASAMLDVSDGLALDAWRIARASGVQLSLSADALLEHFGLQTGDGVPRGPRAAAATEVPLELMLYGGEDHGLLAAFPPASRVPAGFVQIGEVAAAGGEPGVTLRGETVPERGWDSLLTGGTR